jgi:tetratricopeptide (TPR) repeat protein
MTRLAALLALAVLAAPPVLANPAEEAKAMVAEGRYEAAVGRFEEALRADPKNASLHLGLGLALQSLKRYPEALEALEKASRLAPDSPDSFYSLALLYEAAATDPGLLAGPQDAGARRRFRRKARAAWEQVLRLSKDPKRAGTAKEHLARIADAAE